MDDYTSLCERIREHCRQQQWYGPDSDRSGYYMDKGVLKKWSIHDFSASFFPPATEEQLRQAEDESGFPYPPLLRTLYLTIANGGFGPGYGLKGVAGGYRETLVQNGSPADTFADKPQGVMYESRVIEGTISIILAEGEEAPLKPDAERTPVSVIYEDPEPEFIPAAPLEEEYEEKRPDFLELEEYERQHGDPKEIHVADLYDQPLVWSKYFIELCDWGCGRSSHLHARNGRVYDEDEGRVIRRAESLEEWLERWLEPDPANPL